MSLARFIASQRAEYQVPYAAACRALGVSQSWFYKWRDGDVSLRRARREALTARIKYWFFRRDRKDGSPRIARRLREQEGWAISDNTVAKIMAENGWRARPAAGRRSLTRRNQNHRKAPDLVKRDFRPRERPNQVWVGDLTEIPYISCRWYLATVIDLHSRRVVGFAFGPRHDAALARAALCMAIAVRGGDVTGVIMHSDQGGEYTGTLFADACAAAGVRQSMGRTGSALDNAAAETFNATLEWELLADHAPFDDPEHARPAIAAFIDDYNTERLHTATGMLPPTVYEQQIRDAA